MKKIVVGLMLVAVTLTGCTEEELRERGKRAVCIELKERYENAVDKQDDILVRELRREIRRECK